MRDVYPLLLFPLSHIGWEDRLKLQGEGTKLSLGGGEVTTLKGGSVFRWNYKAENTFSHSCSGVYSLLALREQKCV